MINRLVGAVTVVLLSSCNVISGSAWCDFREGSSNGPENRCQERVNMIAVETFKGACEVAQGKPHDGTCPREGVVGGCFVGNQGDGSKVNDWYYAPMTLEEVKRACGSDPFLEP